jgi:hypothetical protein
MNEVVFMDVSLVGAEYASQAVEALIEKPDTLLLIHRCPESARVAWRFLTGLCISALDGGKMCKQTG